ncbi:SDH family Clp fold serine proteinase [Microbacterium sp. SSM24]|uniref:SDH family Clp fold serine proteinase n=1 Tax=Microbacterium sp. SSM24 TaxID=2991714 RepID=UPI0039B48FE4
MIDQVFPYATTLVEELLTGADSSKPLHLLLSTPGGDGEVAVRLVRAMKARCTELTIIVPDMAKSAGTIMCLGADRIIMAAGSDLGPIDPQMQIGGSLVGAREIDQALRDAEERVAAEPNAFPLYAGLLSDVNMLMIEQARSATARTYDLIDEALTCRGLNEEARKAITEAIRGPLVDDAKNHAATVGPELAAKMGLPVELADPASDSWHLIWSLWTRYFQLGAWPAAQNAVYEGQRASQVLTRG